MIAGLAKGMGLHEGAGAGDVDCRTRWGNGDQKGGIAVDLTAWDRAIEAGSESKRAIFAK